MTYTDINGLQNYEDMYRAFQDYEDESARYEASVREGNNDIYLLRKAIGEFRTIIETIIIEFSKKYPMCEVKDSRGVRSIPDTLKMLQDKGYINGKTRELLSSINYFGFVGSHPEKPLNASDYQKISSRYQELLCYMPSFLNQFPEPGDAANNEQTRYCRNCGSPISANAKFCSNCGAPVSDSGYEDNNGDSNFDDKYTDTGFYEEKAQSRKHRNRGIIVAVIVIAILAAVGFIQIGRNSGSSESSIAENDDTLSQDDASTEEKVGETAASESDKEQTKDTASNNDDGTKTHAFTADSSNGLVSITNGVVSYNEDGTALVAFNVENSGPNDLNFGWEDEDYHIELQLANGKTCSTTGIGTIIYVGGNNFFMLSFKDVNANIDQITIYPVYTLSSRGIPENIDNSDTYTLTVHKES